MLRPMRTAPPNVGPTYGLVCEKQDDQNGTEAALTSTTKRAPTWAQILRLVLPRTQKPYN